MAIFRVFYFPFSFTQDQCKFRCYRSIRESNSGRNSKAVLVLLHRHVCGLHGVVTAKEPFRKKKTRWNNRRHDPRFLEALESDRA